MAPVMLQVLSSRPIAKSRLKADYRRHSAASFLAKGPKQQSQGASWPWSSPCGRTMCWQWHRNRSEPSLRALWKALSYPTGITVSLKAFLLACSEMKTKSITRGKDQYPTHCWLILSGCSALENIWLIKGKARSITCCPWSKPFALSWSQGSHL